MSDWIKVDGTMYFEKDIKQLKADVEKLYKMLDREMKLQCLDAGVDVETHDWFKALTAWSQKYGPNT
jgi:hypothetical protein